MAKTLVVRKMRAIGTLTGGPPTVRHMPFSVNVGTGGGVQGDVVCFDQSAGLCDVADFNDTTWLAQATDDQIDDDKITQVVPATATWNSTDGDSLVGILMGDVAASETAPVAMFSSQNVFEANLTSLVDGATEPTALASIVAHLGSHAYIASADTALSWDAVDDASVTITNTLPDGVWVLSDTAATGTTGTFARIIQINYGHTGEDVYSGHGLLADLNIRVRFVVEPAATFLGV